MNLLRKSSDSVPLIFLVTDGAVEDERGICNFVKSYVTSGQSVRTPRICTFGIGKNSGFLFSLWSSENRFCDIIICLTLKPLISVLLTLDDVLRSQNILKLNLGMF